MILSGLLSDMAVKSKSGRILMIEVSSKLKFHKEALKKQGIMKKVDFAKRQSNDVKIYLILLLHELTVTLYM